MRKSSHEHSTVGDGRRAMTSLAQRIAGHFTVLSLGGNYNHFSVRRWTKNMLAHGHRGRIIGATDTVSPQKLPRGGIDAGDDAVISPEKQTSPGDQRRRGERRP